MRDPNDKADYYILIEGTGCRVTPWTISKWRNNQGCGIDDFPTKEKAVDFAKGLVKLYKKAGQDYGLKIKFYDKIKKKWVENTWVEKTIERS